MKTKMPEQKSTKYNEFLSGIHAVNILKKAVSQ